MYWTEIFVIDHNFAESWTFVFYDTDDVSTFTWYMEKE
jgi:hypothetical protein